MGQAKRRQAMAGKDGEGTCNGCKLCCVIPAIPEIGKAPFDPCAKLCDVGCSIHGKGQPKTCIKFDCRYIMAHRLNLKDREFLPHPNEAGAYVSLPRDPRNVVVYIDPADPARWQGSAMPEYLRTLMRAGVGVTVIDRGFQFTLGDMSEIDAFVAVDMVAAALSKGLKPTYAPPPAADAQQGQ